MRGHGLWGAAPAIVLAMVWVVVGGLVAAVTASSPTEHGTWAAAYLVLVAGVAQIGLGVGQALLTVPTPPARARLAQLLLWNGGNAAVLMGTLTGTVRVVDIGGALLVAALSLVVLVVRAHAVRDGDGWQVAVRRVFQFLLILLLVSIPIGLWLARQPGA